MQLRDESRTLVFYESPYRVVKTLQQFVEAYGPDRRVAACREISKIHEECIRGTLQEVLGHFQAHEPKGEFVIILEGMADRKSQKQEERTEFQTNQLQ